MSNNKIEKIVLRGIRDLLAEQQAEEQEKSAYDRTKERYANKEREKQRKRAEDKASKEDSKKDSKKRTSGSKIGAEGALGRGRFLHVVGDLKNRAEKDPAGLLRDLGVSGASGEGDLEKAANIIEQAIAGNEVMGEAFSDPQVVTGDGGDRVVIKPASEEINNRNATKYLLLTLRAAENAGALQLDEGVIFLPRNQVSAPTLTSA